MSTFPKLVYPYTWGRGVVCKFTEKYARGHQNFSKMLGLTPGETMHRMVLVLCRGNSLKWDIIKRTVVASSDYGKGDLSTLSDKERMILYRCIVKIQTDSALDKSSLIETLDLLREGSLF